MSNELEDINEMKEQFADLTEKIKEGQEELRDEVTEKGETLKDVQEDLNEMEAEKTNLKEKITKLEQEMAKEGRLNEGSSDEKKDFGFDSLGEFVSTAVQNSKNSPEDDRLKELGDHMEKDLSTDPGSAGGFLIPDAYGDMVELFTPQEAIFRPRATIVDGGEQPDSKTIMPALDQSGDNGVYAGVSVDWVEEGGKKPETDYDYTDVVLEPSEIAAHIPISDKLLRNAPSVAGTVNQLLTWGIAQAEDDAFMTGDGLGKPLGVIGHDATISQNRDTSDEVNYADIVNMYSNAVMGGEYVWTINQTVLPELMQMTDAGSNLIWQPNAQEGVPGTLLGIPVMINQRQPSLGNTGDVALMDLSYYYINDGVGTMIASSEHVEFLNNKTVIKAFKTVDGQPAIKDTLSLEDGTTVSPFVTLNSSTSA